MPPSPPIWIAETSPPASLIEATRRWSLRCLRPSEIERQTPAPGDVAIIDAAGPCAAELISRLRRRGVTTLRLGTVSQDDAQAGLILPADAPLRELTVRIETALALSGGVTPRARPGRHDRDMDEEMRLASSLQQDFMPRRLPEVGDVRFGVYHRPASFVSGDMYDVARLDETHVGFYVADAVGHGLPAALLTMFIKKALQTKRISGHSYEIVSPDQTLGHLNVDLWRQNLSMCEFCTAVYGIIDTCDLSLTFSRAGHPHPLLLRDGRVERMDIPGPLLGVIEDAEFQATTLPLAAGDRLLFYSDGVEDVLCGKKHVLHPDMSAATAEWGELDREELIDRLATTIGQSPPDDDATAVVCEVIG